MKAILYLCCFLISLASSAGGKLNLAPVPPAENGHWALVIVKGERHNISEPGQNKYVTFECRAPYIEECLRYYRWVTEGVLPGGGNIEIVEPVLPPIPMDQQFYYLSLQTEGGVAMYELTQLQLMVNESGVIVIQILPGITIP